MGILADPDCIKITCMNGCGVHILILFIHKRELLLISIFSMFSVDYVFKVITLASAKQPKRQIRTENAVITLIQLELPRLDGTKLLG